MLKLQDIHVYVLSIIIKIPFTADLLSWGIDIFLFNQK